MDIYAYFYKYFKTILFLSIICISIYALYKSFYYYYEPDGTEYYYDNTDKNNKNIKLILLRHGDRPDEPGFYTELNEKGIERSKKIVNYLDKYDINMIISSPFIRTLQTVTPYADKYNKDINIEYGLYEYRYNKYFRSDPKVYGINDIKQQQLLKHLNSEYISTVQQDDLILGRDDKYDVILETPAELEKRVFKVLDEIFTNPDFENKTILIVSHKGTINMIRKYLEGNKDKNYDFNNRPYEFGHYVVYKNI